MKNLICLLVLSICNIANAKSNVTLGFNINGDVKFPIAFSPNGEYIAVGYSDGSIKLWEITSGLCTKTFSGHGGAVNALVFNRNGNQIISGSEDNLIKIWDAKLGECVRTLVGHKSGITSLSLEPEGNSLASATGYADGEVKIWNINSGECLKTIAHSPGAGAKNVVFSPDGKLLAAGGYNHEIKIYSVSTGDKLFTIDTGSRISSLSFSPTGKQIASSLLGGDIKIWSVSDTTAGLCLLKSEGAYYHSNESIILYNPTHNALVFTNGYQIFTWNLDSNKYSEINYTFRGSEFVSLAYNFDGKMLAAVSSDNAIKIWNTMVRDTAIKTLLNPSLISHSESFVNDSIYPKTPYMPFDIVESSLKFTDEDGDSILEPGELVEIRFLAENFTNSPLYKLKIRATVVGNKSNLRNNKYGHVAEGGIGSVPKLSKTQAMCDFKTPQNFDSLAGFIEVSIRLEGFVNNDSSKKFISPEHKIILPTRAKQ